ncbi:hypothetical protein [Rheinheimera sp. 1928-s]|uniref:lipopolysaccharide biosynthesis protein n=1 Tax=Rheinheimera sp. 1928-s TaxID=3033803 RepID=UPI002618674E|nr:hypothetical protein [Rheinheimera sp. 1928-s]MDF3125696.1 hypothetical protein [Rheinheimera sp. 1928-s]
MEDLGVYAFFFSLSTIVFFLTNLGFRQLIVTSSIYHDTSQYMKVRFVLSIISMVFVSVVGFLLKPDYFVLCLLISSIKFFESISEIGYAYFQKYQNHNYQSKLLFFKSLLSGLLVYFLIKQGFTLTQILFFISSLHFASIVFFELPKLKEELVSLSFFNVFMLNRSDFEFVKFAFPLGVGLFLINLNLNLSRIMSGMYLSEFDTAVLAASLQLSLALTPVVTGFSQVILPKFSKLISNSSVEKAISYFVVLTIVLFFMSTLLMMGAYFFGEVILEYIYNSDIANCYYIFTVCLLGVSFNYIASLSTVVLTACEKYKLQRDIMLFCIVINLFLMLLFIDHYGLASLAWSFVLSSFLRLFLLYVYAGRTLISIRRLKSIP